MSAAEAIRTEDVHEALRGVLDPETGLSVVDLGLIYEAGIDQETRRLRVSMTFTSPGCPAGGAMMEGVERALAGFPGVTGVDVQVTFEPRWTPERISQAGRAQLGW